MSESKSAKTLEASYEPQKFESEIYQNWESLGCFAAKDVNAPGQNAFSIMIPPPNVTGVLHMGHALTNTIQDSLTRWRRMKGDNALWLPGTDHAGIATQTQVEKQIKKEGTGPTGKPLTRYDMGREKFIARVWKWKEDHGREITNQLRRLGSSLDWKRERFTMDEGCSRAVIEVFCRLYEEGLIYRGERIINWCPVTQTALSDLEVIPTEKKGNLWHLRYFIVEKDGSPVKDADGKPASLVIATTRPETLLGDTAVAVHPEDERYTRYQGKFARLPLLGRLIPVITDEYVDRAFGTGALKVTPAHDFNDYEIGKRHSLPFISVMGKDGRITQEGGPYADLKFADARTKVVEDLKAAELLVKVEDHVHKVGMSQRADCPAEPIVSEQWFVKIEPLAKPAIAAVETGKIQFSPKSWEKTYFEWMYNIRDWCISRQLWWGHQIPAWYCGDCSKITVARSAPVKCSHCGASASKLKQDEDVLDTWFSSALWPFATLGWPEKTDALKTFYPNSILETGFDIIFFWVARMIMMGIHFMGDVPFRKVYLHAMVRDEKGEKMSKSKGNVIDPLELINAHGADPLRFTLLSMAGQGRDVKLSVDRVEGYRAFCNKIWNATKFFLMQFDDAQGGSVAAPKEGLEAYILARAKSGSGGLLESNRYLLSQYTRLIATVERGLENFEIDESARALYEFAWKEFCDWSIEISKVTLKESGRREETLYVMGYVLDGMLKLMHPLMPFVTEKLWQGLPWSADGQLMMQAYPKARPEFIDEGVEKKMQAFKSIVEAIRNFRGENNIAPKVPFQVFYAAKDAAASQLVSEFSAMATALTRVTGFQAVSTPAPTDGSQSLIPLATPAVELRIPIEGLIDRAEERKRVEREIARTNDDLEFVRGKLSKESFIAKAPPALVEKERAKEKELASRLEELNRTLARLK